MNLMNPGIVIVACLERNKHALIPLAGAHSMVHIERPSWDWDDEK